MAEKNSTQNLVTTASIIIALVAVIYAFTVKMDEQKVIEVEEPQMVENTYEIGEDNPVVMIIDGENVTRMQIMDNFAQSGSQLPAGADMQQIFPLLQEQYLIGELIENAAKDKGIDANNPKVQERLNQVLDQALRAAYIEEVGKEKVTDADVQKAYDDIIGNAPAQMERKARHILLKDEATANALIVKLNQGADFATLAEKNSTGPTGAKGGDLGYFANGEMVPEFERAAYALEIGNFTQKPIKTQFGYHIIMVEDERQRAKPAFEDVKEQLANQLRQAATAETIQDLRANAEITMFDFTGAEVKQAEEDNAEIMIEDESTTESEVETELDVETNDVSESTDTMSDDATTTDVVEPKPATE